MLLTPEIDENKLYSIPFPLTFCGQNQHYSITFQNIGVIPCLVILEIIDSTDVFELNECKLYVAPKQLGNVDVLFAPRHEGEFKSTIKLYVINNPFEHFQVRTSCLFTFTII